MKKFKFGLAASAAGMLFAGAANAAVTFQIVAEQSAYNVIPGATTTVNVYLRETVTGGSSSILVGEDGLFSAAAQINRTVSAGTGVSPTGVIGNTAVFDDLPTFDSEVTATSASFVEARVEFENGPTGTEVASGVRDVYLGGFVFDVPLNATGSSTFALTTPPTDDFLTNFGTILDGQIADGSFELTVVPEPATAGLVGLLGAATLLGRRRRI